MKSVPICIVGGGPVGMVLALNLNALGVRSIVVNANSESLQLPRGSTQNARTMEHYRRLGLAAGIRKLGLPSDHPTDVVYYTRLDGWELARIAMPSESQKMATVRDASPTAQVVEPILRCNQMYVERYVLDHLKSVSNVELRYGWSCIGWREDADGVVVEIEERGTGRIEKIRSSYLVGCDGGQSFVRRQLGIHYSGEADNPGQAYLSGMMVSTHIRAPGFATRFPHRLGWQNWTLNASLRANMVSLNGKDELILLSQLPSPDHKPDTDLIARRFVAATGMETGFEVLSHWTWVPGRALVADSYGCGRTVLAGDAVHLFTPTGGFGMNTGVDDAGNLGWKLAALVQGWGGEKLLASYEAERRPIGFRNTGLARLFSRNVGSLPISSDIEEDSPRGSAARAEVGRAAADFAEEFASIGIQLGARYDNSPIVMPDGTAPPADAPFAYVPSACPGGRAPHAWLPGHVSLFDCFGGGFTLLRMRDMSDSGASLVAAAARRKIPLKVLDVEMAEVRDLYGASLALIRPDQHVAWRGNAAPNDCDALLAHVTGW